MATYKPEIPYGARWGFRTPSPPPASEIEPISPLIATEEPNIPIGDLKLIQDLQSIQGVDHILRAPTQPVADDATSESSEARGSEAEANAQLLLSAAPRQTPIFVGDASYNPLDVLANAALRFESPMGRYGVGAPTFSPYESVGTRGSPFSRYGDEYRVRTPTPGRNNSFRKKERGPAIHPLRREPSARVSVPLSLLTPSKTSAQPNTYIGEECEDSMEARQLSDSSPSVLEKSIGRSSPSAVDSAEDTSYDILPSPETHHHFPPRRPRFPSIHDTVHSSNRSDKENETLRTENSSDEFVADGTKPQQGGNKDVATQPTARGGAQPQRTEYGDKVSIDKDSINKERTVEDIIPAQDASQEISSSVSPTVSENSASMGSISTASTAITTPATGGKYIKRTLEVAADVLEKPVRGKLQVHSQSANVQDDRNVNEDICEVCKLTEEASLAAIPPDAPASDRAAVMQWVQCDGCKGWHHNACVGLTKEVVDLIDKYHCKTCELTKGPSTYLRKSSRPRVPIDYEMLDNGSLRPVQSSINKNYHPYVDRILSGDIELEREFFPRVRPEELTAKFFENGGGFRQPVVIPAAMNPYPRSGADKDDDEEGGANSRGASPMGWPNKDHIEVDAIGMGFPDNLTIRKVVDMVGPDKMVEVIDVKHQIGEQRKWSLSKWADYYEDPTRSRIYNVISLEVSNTPLGYRIQRPKIVRELDLSDQVWPQEKFKEFPNVQYYCLMSVAHAYTDWHIDFGGSSVYYRILKGKKVFFFMEPTPENLDAYEKWNLNPDQSWTWLAEGRKCYKIELGPGDTMLIPSGWLHAVYTPEDSLVIGGNFLTKLDFQMQFRIHDIEKATNTHQKYRFPRFARVHWYAAQKMLHDDPIPDRMDEYMLQGKPVDYRRPRDAPELCDWILEGLPAVAFFLHRNSLIAQDIISLDNQKKTLAVRNAIPKELDDGWEFVQQFARWVTWKRNCGEVIPTWAHTNADPAEGVPQQQRGERKVSAAAVKRAERNKVIEEVRAAGLLRTSGRERRGMSATASEAVSTSADEDSRKRQQTSEVEGSSKRARKDSTPFTASKPKKTRVIRADLDIESIDFCLDQALSTYDASTDRFKKAIAVEVREHYARIKAEKVAPIRLTCAPCRVSKVKCKHKEEIGALCTKVLQLYHDAKGIPAAEREADQHSILGSLAPISQDQPAGESSSSAEPPKRTIEVVAKPKLVPKPKKSRVVKAPNQKPAALPAVRPEMTEPTSPGSVADSGPPTATIVSKAPSPPPMAITPAMPPPPRPPSKPLSKPPAKSRKPVSAIPNSPVRKRGGHRTACEHCRSQKRKCTHGPSGAPRRIKKLVARMASLSSLANAHSPTTPNGTKEKDVYDVESTSSESADEDADAVESDSSTDKAAARQLLQTLSRAGEGAGEGEGAARKATGVQVVVETVPVPTAAELVKSRKRGSPTTAPGGGQEEAAAAAVAPAAKRRGAARKGRG